MRKAVLPAVAALLLLAACSKGEKQADALDRAAAQSDPAAAATLRNAADAIREDGTDTNLSAAGSPAQEALTNAGAVAAKDPVASPQKAPKPVDPQTGLTKQ